MALTTSVEPHFFIEAMKYEVWKNAMGSEIDALQRNHTWNLEELPPDKKALGSKWVFTIKLRSDGTIERHKLVLLFLIIIKKKDLIMPTRFLRLQR